MSSIPFKDVYKEGDIKDIRDELKEELPGKFPYTRGIYPDMYRRRLWTMRQYAGFGSPKDTNERFQFLLSQGQTGLSCAFDLPTQLGYDADNPISKGEVGRTGVPMSTLEDFMVLFEGIPLEDVSVSMTINATAPVIMAMYIVTAERRGTIFSKLSGTVQNDILKEFTARGNYIYPVEESMRLVGDLIEYTVEKLPKWNPISVSGYHYREAGATASEEIALTIADALAYIEEIKKRDIPLERVLPRFSFFFSAHNNFLEEIAKFRATRRIWSRIVREKLGVSETKAELMRFHTQTAGSTLVPVEPFNNIVRVTLQALSAVLGGTQSLHTNSYDEAISLPSEEAVKTALRTQQIIACETGIRNTPDPLGGSFAIERLTRDMEERILAILDEIEREGGAVESIKRGRFQRMIEKSAYEYQKAIEKGTIKVVGINIFEEEVISCDSFRVDPELEALQIKRLEKYKTKRDFDIVNRSLDRIRKMAEGEENLMPYIIDTVRSGATLGEISDALRDVWGEYEEIM